jgi:hypothetical protein
MIHLFLKEQGIQSMDEFDALYKPDFLCPKCGNPMWMEHDGTVSCVTFDCELNNVKFRPKWPSATLERVMDWENDAGILEGFEVDNEQPD